MLQLQMPAKKFRPKQAGDDSDKLNTSMKTGTTVTNQSSVGFKRQAEQLKQVKNEIKETEKELTKLKQSEALSKVGSELKSQFSTIFTAAGLAGLAVNTISSAFQGVKEFIKGSSEEFINAEKSVKQLEFAVKSIAGGSDSTFMEFKKQARELSSIGDFSIFTHEQIEAAQRMGIDMNLTTEEVKKLIPIVIDAASATGMDLEQAMQKVLLGINGNTKGLKQLGVFIKDTGDKSENYNLILEKLIKYQGAAIVSYTYFFSINIIPLVF